MILTRKYIILTFTTFIFLLPPRLLRPSHVMIKIIIFFVSLLRSLRHDQKKNNNLVTTFTTSWIRVINLFFWFRDYVPYAMIKRKTFYFSFRHYVQYAMITEKNIFISSLLWLRYNYEKNGFFCFIGTFIMEISFYMIIHLPAALNTSLTCQKNPKQYTPHEKHV